MPSRGYDRRNPCDRCGQRPWDHRYQVGPGIVARGLSYSVCDACNVEILAGWLDAQITRRDPDSGVCEYCRHGKYQVKAPRPGFLEPLMMYGGGSIGEAHHPGVLLCRECILRVVRAVIMRERYGP